MTDQSREAYEMTPLETSRSDFYGTLNGWKRSNISGDEMVEALLKHEAATRADAEAPIEAAVCKIEERSQGQLEWLAAEYPGLWVLPIHEEGSVERAIWHSGSASALTDSANLIRAALADPEQEAPRG